MSDGNTEPKPGSKWPAFVLGASITSLVIVAIQSSVPLYDEGDLKEATAQQSAKVLEQACRNYALKYGGLPPDNLEELVAPKDGGRPFVEGGAGALIDPWGNPYRYDPSNKKPDGTPDFIVFTFYPKTGEAILALNRK